MVLPVGTPARFFTMLDTARSLPLEDVSLPARLLAGDPVAPALFCQAWLPRLRDWIERRFPHADPHLREDALEDTLLDFVSDPSGYDPNRGPLAPYLHTILSRKLWRSQSREGSRFQGKKLFECVEDRPAEANLEVEDDRAARLDQLVEAAVLDATERQVLTCMLAGERRSAVIARALGLPGSAQEQRQMVKRLKDRVLKRLLRGRQS